MRGEREEKERMREVHTLHPSFFSIKALQPGHALTSDFINSVHSLNCEFAAISDSLYLTIKRGKEIEGVES